MTIVCNIWMICLELNWFVYDPSWMLHLSKFVWTLRSSVLVVFNNFLLIEPTDRSKFSSDQKRFFIALRLSTLHFSRTLPLKKIYFLIFTFVRSVFNSNQYIPSSFSSFSDLFQNFCAFSLQLFELMLYQTKTCWQKHIKIYL